MRLRGLESIFSRKWRKRWGLEFGSECDGNGSVNEHVMTKQNCTEVEHVKTRLLSSSIAELLDSSILNASSNCYL